MEVKRGDIWIADLGTNFGSEQNGRRPCLIVQNDVGNSNGATTIICPISTKSREDLPMHVVTNDLRKKSIIKCESIRSIDKSRLEFRVARIDTTMVDEALRLTLGL